MLYFDFFLAYDKIPCFTHLRKNSSHNYCKFVIGVSQNTESVFESVIVD
jgi:hypothetical protein